MNYELAKELKEAGFPQQIRQGDSVYNDRGIELKLFKYGEFVDIASESDDWYKMPTLSELIEACGERFEGLRRQPDPDIETPEIWFADRDGYCSPGSSPEEAVARLWMVLNNGNKNTKNAE